LQIGVHAVGERIVVSVSNPGLLEAAGMPAGTIAAGLGLGTGNIRERLTLHYGPNARFSLVQEGDLVVARLDLPRPRDGV
jgi:LytS/YehU family sensor histidine kinase